MPWYYAGPEAKPVGPVSLDELHARRASGAILPTTYVLEHTGQPDGSATWRRYQEIFPASPVQPSLPPPPPVPAMLTPQPAMPSHPLFPSAVSVPQPAFSPGHRPDPYYQVKPTNGWCVWGFWLGLVAFLPSFCGIGLFLALPALVLCIVGLVQVQKRPEQSGQGMAIAGLILSGVALLIAAILIVSVALPIMQAQEQTVTEQTTNDTD